MAKSFERHLAVPSHVSLSVPRTRVEAEEVQAQLRARLDSWVGRFGPMPPRGRVNLRVDSERKWSWFDGYLEQHVTYEGEPNERIPAYLLIPNKGSPPFPAVVAHHQCYVDCDVGKEAVVGKAYLRPDQAFGFELVNRGYVVLAPDSINCGERNVNGVREQGVRDKTKCWSAVMNHLSVGSFYLKHLYDSTRAVDLLESLSFVDHDRIGMIGHSLGAGTTFWTMAYDTRVKAGVVSCHFLGGLSDGGWGHFYKAPRSGIYYHEMLGMMPPRALLATRGERETPLGPEDLQSTEEERSVLRWAFDYGRLFCRLYGVSEERVQVRVFEGGHEFPKDEREHAYHWLDTVLAS